MPSLRKTLKCSCGTYVNFDFSTDLNVDDLTISGRCPSCGKDMHISVVSMGSGSVSSQGSGNYGAGSGGAGTSQSGSSGSSGGFSGDENLGQAIEEAEKKDEYGLDEAEYDKVSGENINKAINEMFGY